MCSNPITLGPSLWKHHIVGDADWILDLLPNSPAVRGIAEILLAGPIKPTRRARGVYTIFPTVEPTGLGQGGGHTDTVAHPLCFMAYLADAPPRNGAFTLWPGSHKIMFRAHHQRTNWSPIDADEQAYTYMATVDEHGAGGKKAPR